MKCKIIQQKTLTTECWSVQIWGLSYCDKCEFKDTNQCGGKRIRETGKNRIGYYIGINGLGSAYNNINVN